MPVEYHLFLVSTCKLAWILCEWSTLTWVQCGRSNLTWFQCRMKWIWLLCRLSKMPSSQCGGSALIWFSRTGRKWRDVFGVMIEINRVFESGLQNWLDIRVAIEMEIYWFLCAGLKLTWFWRRDPTRLFFWSRSRTTSVLCAGRKLLGFNL